MWPQLRAGLAAATLAFGVASMPVPTHAAQSTPSASTAAATRTLSRSVVVNGIEIAYREAGPKDGPVVLLLHGFPSSSHMFRELIPALAGKYRVIAPDYPGFGTSAAPAIGAFPYTFAALTDLIDGFTTAVGAKDYVIFMQDYGGPVGFRLAVKHPERVRGIVVQNAVASVESWNPDVVKQFAPYWQNRNAETEKPVRGILTAEMTKFQYTHGANRTERVSPDAWVHDQANLDKPGNVAIQLEYLYNYQDNVAQYPAWKSYLTTHKPRMLIVWGKNDPFFTLNGVEYFKSLLPGVEVHLYDAGHFALETHVDEIAEAMLTFLAKAPR